MYPTWTNEQLRKRVEFLENCIKSYSEELVLVNNEIYARKYGIRVGETFRIGHDEWRIEALDDHWPVCRRRLRNSDGWATHTSNAYLWERWKAGKARSPFRV
jgi:hypothetical protein